LGLGTASGEGRRKRRHDQFAGFGHCPLHARQRGGQALALVQLQGGLAEPLAQQPQVRGEVGTGVGGGVDRVAGGPLDIGLSVRMAPPAAT
jgi:hypothetical protein